MTQPWAVLLIITLIALAELCWRFPQAALLVLIGATVLGLMLADPGRW